MRKQYRQPALSPSPPPNCSGFSMAEMLIVMGIMTVLAAALIVLVPKLRTTAMCKQAAADIQQLSIALTEYKNDKGVYPDRPYTFPSGVAPNPVVQTDCVDYVLYKSLTDPDYPAPGKGWAMARTDWQFLRGDSATKRQFLDPWGVPYYYIPYTSYLIGVRVYDPTDGTPATDTTKTPATALPNCFGTTPAWDDSLDPNDEMKSRYPSPAILQQNFYNSTTFQIHSKGPDQRTDYYSDAPAILADPKKRAFIDACDRGQDPDDITNFGGGN